MEKQPLTIEQRAERVVCSQGKAFAFFRTLTTEEKAKLAEWCDESGIVRNGTPQKFKKFLIEYYEARKASHEETDEE